MCRCISIGWCVLQLEACESGSIRFPAIYRCQFTKTSVIFCLVQCSYFRQWYMASKHSSIPTKQTYSTYTQFGNATIAAKSVIVCSECLCNPFYISEHVYVFSRSDGLSSTGVAAAAVAALFSLLDGPFFVSAIRVNRPRIETHEPKWRATEENKTEWTKRDK